MKTHRTSPQFVFLIGPTCVGKGYLMNLIQEFISLLVQLKLLRVGMITFGDVVKKLLREDAAFREKYGHVVGGGKLVDDVTASEIFQRLIDPILAEDPHIVIVDGFCRTVGQVAYAAKQGYLGPESKVFMLRAPLETCAKRFLHRKDKASEKRVDDEFRTFYERYHLHVDTHEPKLREMIRECECELVEVDAKGDIKDEVWKTVKENLNPDFLRSASVQRELTTA